MKEFFKERNEILEQRLDEIKVKLLNMENVEKRLESNEQMLVEKQNRLNELQAEHRQMAQQVNSSSSILYVLFIFF